MLEKYDTERIIIFTGPDGSGRSSIAEAVGQTFGMAKVISHVTRKPRPGEINGQDYHYISKDEYSKMEQQGEFLESVEFDGHFYGIRRSDVEKNLSDYGCVYMVLNREGSELFKKIYGDTVTRIFLFADRRILEERNRAQGLEGDSLAKRMNSYDGEMDYRAACEHSFENIDLADTVSRVTELLEGYLQRNLVDKD